MQSFRYQLPRQPRGPRRPGGRAWRAIAACACLLALGAGVWWAAPATGLGAAMVDTIGGFWVRPAGAAEREREADAELAECARAMAAGNWRAAAESADRAMALAASQAAYRFALDARYLLAKSGHEAPALPRDVTTWLSAGAAELQAKRFEAALAAFETASALAPKDARASFGRGQALEALARLDEALAAFEQAQALAPRDSAVTEALLALRTRRGDGQRALATAIESYRARAGQTDDEAVHVGLLDAYERQGLAPAELKARHAAEAPQLSAAERDYYWASAAMRHYQRNPRWNEPAFDQVVGACRQVLTTQAAADSPWRGKAGALLARAYEARAQRFLARSDFEAARVQLVKALEQGRYLAVSERADLHVQFARLLPLVGQAEQAAKAYEAALALDPNHACRDELARWHGHVGVALLAAGKAKEAAVPLRRALAADPGSGALLARLHQALSRANHQAPLTAAAQVAHLPLKEARVRLAEGLLAIGRPADAAKAAAEASRAGASRAALSALNAELALAAGQRNAARKALVAAIALAPTAAHWRRLGEIDLALAHGAKAEGRAGLLQRSSEAFARSLALGGGERARGHLLGLHKRLAESALARSDHATARRLAGEALVLAPHNPALSLLEGQALEALGSAAEARAAYESGLSGLGGAGDPVAARLHDRLGHLLLGLGEHEAAIRALQSGLAPDAAAGPLVCASLYYGLTKAYAGNGLREQAVEAAHQYLFWSFHDPHEVTRVPEVQQLESQLAKF